MNQKLLKKLINCIAPMRLRRQKIATIFWYKDGLMATDCTMLVYIKECSEEFKAPYSYDTAPPEKIIKIALESKHLKEYENLEDLLKKDPSYIPTLTKRMGAIAHLIRFLPYEIYASKGTCKKNKKILIDINSNRYNITIIVAKY